MLSNSATDLIKALVPSQRKHWTSSSRALACSALIPHSLMVSDHKGDPDAAMRCWRPLSKTSNSIPEIKLPSKKFKLVKSRDFSFGNNAVCACAIVLASCTRVLSLLSCFRSLPCLLDPAFVTVGAVSARTKVLVPSPATCILVTFEQQLKISTQFMSVILSADTEINSRFEIGNILHWNPFPTVLTGRERVTKG